MDDGGVHHGALGNQQPLGLEMDIDFVEQSRGQVVRLQQMPEVEYHGLVRQGVGDTTETCKAAHAFNLVQASSICRSDKLNPFCMQ
jgi:hypothetical protein